MAPRTAADTEMIRQFALFADNTSQELEGMRRRLDSQLAAISATWKGDGGNAFRVTASTVQRETAVMNQAMAALGGDVRFAGLNYEAADADQAAKMRASDAQTTGITSALTL